MENTVDERWVIKSIPGIRNKKRWSSP